MNKSNFLKKIIICKNCGYKFEKEIKTVFNENERDEIFKKDPFVFNCPQCDSEIHCLVPITYIDRERKFLVLTDEPAKLLYHNYLNKISGKYSGCTICSSTNYYGFKTNIVSLEEGLDWRIVNIYLRQAALRKNRLYCKNNNLSEHVEYLLLYKKDNQLFCKYSTVEGDEQGRQFKFNFNEYQKVYDKYIGYINKVNPFFLDKENIEYLNIIKRKVKSVVYPITDYYYVENGPYFDVAMSLNDVVSDQIEINDWVEYEDLGNKYHLYGRVVGHEKMDFFLVPLHVKYMGRIIAKSTRIIAKSSFSNNIVIDDRELLDARNEYFKNHSIKNEQKMEELINKSQYIIVDPSYKSAFVHGILYDEKERIAESVCIVSNKKGRYIAAFSSQDKVNIEGNEYIFGFDTLVKLYKNNVFVDGVVINPNTDYEISIKASKLREIGSDTLVRNKKELKEFVGCITEKQRKYFNELEYECLVAKLMNNLTYKQMSEKYGISIKLAKQKYDFALISVKNLYDAEH